MRRSPADSTNRSLAAFGKLQHIPGKPLVEGSEHQPHERRGAARGRVHLESGRRKAPTRPLAERPVEPIGYVPPAEYETQYYTQAAMT